MHGSGLVAHKAVAMIQETVADSALCKELWLAVYENLASVTCVLGRGCLTVAGA